MDKVIITGHSSGLGEALARAWLECEARVLGISRRPALDLLAEYPFDMQEYCLDMSNTQALIQYLESSHLARFVHDAHRLWVFNNAGTIEPAQVLGEQSAMDIALAVQLNVSAALIWANWAATQAKHYVQVNVVHITSGAAYKAYAGWTIYGACKAALDQHARVSFAESIPNVRVVAIAPGVVDTPMQKSIRDNIYFPSRNRFTKLYRDKALQTPEDTAVKIVSYCLSHEFASKPIVDVRDL